MNESHDKLDKVVAAGTAKPVASFFYFGMTLKYPNNISSNLALPPLPRGQNGCTGDMGSHSQLIANVNAQNVIAQLLELVMGASPTLLPSLLTPGLELTQANPCSCS